MSLRTIERLVIAGSLLLGVAAMGCGDDDDPPEDAGMDAGEQRQDAGRDATADTGGGGGDTGADTGDGNGETITCGTNTCSGAVIANLDVAPCCVDDGDVCGLDAADIKKASPSSPFTGCVPKDVEAASESEYCGAFFDQIEPDGDHENGGLDIKSGNRYAVFEGCCLPSGECGASITVPRGADAELNSHLGCVSFGRLRDALEEQGEEPSEELPDHLPFCNPETGQPPTTGTVPGVPAFVCGCGDGVVDDGVGLPCLNNLEATVCGADTPTTDQLEDVPEFVCGCTANSKLPCLRNVAAATCGGKAIDASSAELAAVPEFICGCTADSKLPCMANVESTVCGGKAITADSAELDSLPAFICGAVGLPAPSALPTMPNVEANICGKKAITADSAELNSLPVFVCGAVNNPDTSALPPKLRNVDVAICGKAPVAAGSPFLATVPKFLCGCTNNNARDLGCLRNVDVAVCGAATPSAQVLALVPEFVCGCGVENRDSGFTRLCMSLVDVATCGTRQETVTDRGAAGPSADDCLAGVPEYARGCGDAEGTTCLRRTAQLFGCDNVTTGPVRRIPEYLCGCGEAKPVGAGTGDASLPCLPFVLETICGATPISASQQVLGIPNIVCGCGDGTTTQAAPCLDNVPPSICGAQQICALGQNGTAAGCASDTQSCVDVQGGAGAQAGGVGGAGDGIGDNCVPPI